MNDVRQHRRIIKGRGFDVLPTAWSDTLARVSLIARGWADERLLVWGTVAQLGVILLALLLTRLAAWPLRRWLYNRAARVHPAPVTYIATSIVDVTPWVVLILLGEFGELAFVRAGQPTVVLRLIVSLAIAWVVVRIGSGLIRNPRLARIVAVVAWLFAALNIAGLLTPTFNLLDAMALQLGGLRLSLLLVLKALLVLAILLWLAGLLARLIEHHLSQLPEITPAMQVLASKLARILLFALAIVLALATAGIDLTALAVFSGAVGVGIGFGLQKVVSNLVSGVILLLDSSIKPGDVIELEHTYGWITQLNARYVSLITRDGTEHLIPNEDLITHRVVNWTYSTDKLRLHVPMGISYKSDARLAIRLAVEAASSVKRVLKDPAPVCLMKKFGDSTLDIELRFWIDDPRAGISNVKSEVMLQIWDRFQVAGIDMPFPQHDVHLVDTPLRSSRDEKGTGAIRQARP